MNVKHKRHIFYFWTKKKIDKNLLSRRKRAIAWITYAGDKAGFPKSGHIYGKSHFDPIVRFGGFPQIKSRMYYQLVWHGWPWPSCSAGSPIIPLHHLWIKPHSNKPNLRNLRLNVFSLQFYGYWFCELHIHWIICSYITAFLRSNLIVSKTFQLCGIISGLGCLHGRNVKKKMIFIYYDSMMPPDKTNFRRAFFIYLLEFQKYRQLQTCQIALADMQILSRENYCSHFSVQSNGTSDSKCISGYKI